MQYFGSIFLGSIQRECNHSSIITAKKKGTYGRSFSWISGAMTECFYSFLSIISFDFSQFCQINDKLKISSSSWVAATGTLVSGLKKENGIICFSCYTLRIRREVERHVASKEKFSRRCFREGKQRVNPIQNLIIHQRSTELLAT